MAHVKPASFRPQPGIARIGILLLASMFLLLSVGCNPVPTDSADSIQYYTATTQKAYEDVVDELRIAITEHNFRITSHSRVGKVIRSRGDKDFPDFDTIQFCNLSHARTLLKLSPESIRHMPCSVVVYTRGEQVIVRARLLPVDSNNAEINRFAGKINDILRTIVNFSVEN